ncbi:MAG TPA: dinitrogenase iron-molybdenum cofactor biosynthesis protein [Bacteroidales bacterium]|jgi:predicted Fe-Mo cluster-binding NifX family protein|nr:dinitrogenase iron-molybdenum cofactor biosynthesis protein [Bacteroidales bacterium]
MKIAIPTRNNNVDEHFGHCEYYTIFSIDENKNVVEKEVIDSPQGCGCKSDIAGILQQKGVKLLLAGNMGAGAMSKLNTFGIDVLRGCAGDVQAVTEAYLKGELNDSGESCDHHNHHH